MLVYFVHVYFSNDNYVVYFNARKCCWKYDVNKVLGLESVFYNQLTMRLDKPGYERAVVM